MYRDVNLSSYDSATLRYHYWLDSEEGYDYLRVGYYNGSWQWVKSYNGHISNWVQGSISVPTTATRVGFLFSTDLSVTYEGAYIDDVTLTGYRLTPIPDPYINITDDYEEYGNITASGTATCDGYDFDIAPACPAHHAVIFKLNITASNGGPWTDSFLELVSNPPNMPSNPSPGNNATGISVNADLSWTGGDLDAGDMVNYTVFFGTNSKPPLKGTIGPYLGNRTSLTYDPGTMNYTTEYYWKIVATDNHGESTEGPVWNFTTGSPTTTGGGGGGGGGGAAPSLEIKLPGKTVSYSIGSDCACGKAVSITSGDGLVGVNIDMGTVALDKNGKCLKSITGGVNQTPPPPPEGAYLIGSAYDFSPVGATFNPAMSLTLKYNDTALPEGVEEQNLVVAYYDAGNNSWEELDCSHNVGNNTVTAAVSHFTTFAIIGEATSPAPAEFTITGFALSSSKVKPGQKLIARVNVTNSGGSEGSYTLNLTINEEVEQTKTVTLAPQATETVTFSITKGEPGSYSVSVDGLTRVFTVTAPPWLSRYWWTIVAGIVIVGLLVYFLFRRKRARPTAAE